MTSPPAPRRAPDSARAEAQMCAWFAHLPRGTSAPGGLGLETSAAPARAAVARPLRWSHLGSAAAALLLAALALPGGQRTAPSGPAPASGPDVALAVAVVDDPSVPLLHALETFDQLAALAAESGSFEVGRGDR